MGEEVDARRCSGGGGGVDDTGMPCQRVGRRWRREEPPAAAAAGGCALCPSGGRSGGGRKGGADPTAQIGLATLGLQMIASPLNGPPKWASDFVGYVGCNFVGPSHLWASNSHGVILSSCNPW